MIYCLADLQARSFVAKLFYRLVQCCGSEMFIPYPNIFNPRSRIQGQKGIGTLDPGYGSALKN